MLMFILLATLPHIKANIAVLSEENYPQCAAVLISSEKALTAAHCVSDSPDVMLRCNGEDHPASVFKVDYNEDLAVLQLIIPCMAPLVRLASTNPEVGSEIHHTGYPRHMPRMTRGIVSAYELSSVPAMPHNPVPQSRLFLVADITIDGGSSGGALYNLAGDLIGICTMREGVFSFFSPLSRIKKFLQ